MSNIDDKIQELHDGLTLHIEEELVRDTEMSTKLTSLDDKVKSLNTDIRTLLDLWEQARGMVTLVKWCAAIGGFLITLVAFFKGK